MEARQEAATLAAYIRPRQSFKKFLVEKWRDFKDTRRQKIEEKDGVHKAWYDEARKIEDPKALDKFVRHLRDDYQHDYGTICHAVAAAAIAAAWCINGEPRQGGITGFQAGAIMWEYIRAWQNLKGPARLVKFEDMLFPQHAERFAPVMTLETWAWLRAEADRNIVEHKKTGNHVHADVLKHWVDVSAGIIPFGWRLGTAE